MNGYSYTNLYSTSEIKSDSKDFQGFDLEQGKVGVIANCEQELEIPLSAVLPSWAAIRQKRPSG